jgi:hypothetical protein
MPIVATGSVSVFFHEAVEDAMRARSIRATDGTTHYLVSLLTDYAKPAQRTGDALDRPAAFLLDEALNTPVPGERFDKLRTLGDGVLYACGFFGDHFEARGVDQSYLIGIGTTAYGNAGSMLRAAAEEERRPFDVFAELAENFASFVAVLADIAESTMARGAATSKSLVQLYERWLRTGSERLAQALTSQGLLPTRAATLGGKPVVQ